MKQKLLKITLILTLGVFALSCSPGGADFIDELDLVYTNYDVSYDFQSKSTYSLPDKVVLITDDFIGGEPGDEPEYLDPKYGNLILSSIRSNMNDLGYTEVNSSVNPDLIILPSVSQTDKIYYYYDWWYWSWFYPGWGPGWGWWYPGYYPPTISRYRTGTLLMQMTDPNAIDETEKVPVFWTGIFNGLIEGSENSINNRVNASINQAFDQSPYLAK
ncbi:DUF4136 domain-containing protein [Algoriphagus halophilus]|uniref:DUF4136 domain-containing protein n=1 Tax=Algoriphagus halophilus TaxID=226505 RepID=UPI00358DE379